MSRYIFDIEGDALLDDVTVIHSLVLVDIDTEQVYSYADQPTYPPIRDGIERMKQAKLLSGHNIIDYDLPAIKKLLGVEFDAHIHDTLVMSRVIFSNLMTIDFNNRLRPEALIGSHSLEAWGTRLGYPKFEFNDFSKWTNEMQIYCEQDTKVNLELYKYLMKQEPSEVMLEIEHDFRKIIFKQEQAGCPFNVAAAKKLKRELEADIEQLTNKLQALLPQNIKRRTLIPKRDNQVKGYKKGVPVVIEKAESFNPNSRVQLIKYLTDRYNWKADTFTDNGNPKLDAEALEKIKGLGTEIPEIQKLLDMNKLAGQLYAGKNAWLKHVKNGRIHGRVNTNGAITGRCTHSKPNLAQVPSIRAYRGAEARALFYAPPPFVMVGADASGLELRMLSHYLTPLDKGRYIAIVLDGDVHTSNQTDAGLATRDSAKTFIYAFIYGAGDTKLGTIVEPTATETKHRAIGKELRSKFLRSNPALDRLIDTVQRRFRSRGHLVGLDGRKLFPTGDHSALNTLLQSAGAIVMKMALIIAYREWTERKLNVTPVLNVHDEFQVLVLPNEAEQVGTIMVDAIVKAGEYFKLLCPLDGEYRIGANWKETH